MQRNRSYLETLHNFNFPAISNRVKRQHTSEVVYITAKANETLPGVVEYHHECPVCEFYCEILHDLKEHVYEKHPAILPVALSSSTSPTPSTSSTKKLPPAKAVPVKRRKPDDDDTGDQLEKEQLDSTEYTVYPLSSDGHLMADEFDVSQAFFFCI